MENRRMTDEQLYLRQEDLDPFSDTVEIEIIEEALARGRERDEARAALEVREEALAMSIKDTEHFMKECNAAMLKVSDLEAQLSSLKEANSTAREALRETIERLEAVYNMESWALGKEEIDAWRKVMGDTPRP